MRAALVVALALSLVACARGIETTFAPMQSESPAFVYYTYTARAGSTPNEPAAEAKRITWLEDWLADNGHKGKRYEIVERKEVKHEALAGPSYTLHYIVRVPK